MADRERLPWWERLNKSLRPFMGPAQLGPFDEAPRPSSTGKPCPLCGAPLDTHVIERGAGSTRLHCPAPVAPTP